MLSFLPGPLLGVFSFTLWILNTVIMCTVLYIFVLLKALIPFKPFRRFCSSILVNIASCWISINGEIIALTQNIEWQVNENCELDPESSYLILANHQSWIDIVVLQKIFNRRIPFLRFFIKHQLFWVPFLGIAWWALDFPFMRRYSPKYLEKYPHKKGQDLETTKKSCEKFRDSPTSILIFAEGTRFTKEKHQKRNSPYQFLLPPKAGGVSTVLEAMGDQLRSALDVTIHYPHPPKSFFSLFTGKLRKVVVEINEYPLPVIPNNDFSQSATTYEQTRKWVKTIWSKKDKVLQSFFS